MLVLSLLAEQFRYHSLKYWREWAASSEKVNQLLERERRKVLQHHGDVKLGDSLRDGFEDGDDGSE